jgi:ATP-binding cassette subfamily C protein
VSLVEQSTNLIRGSIAEYVALGVSLADIDLDQLNLALESAELSEWVGQLSGGVESVVDPGSMSGGQLQRLGLARALYTKPSLLVLDEPTSALDADTEHKISQTLEKLRGNMTQISIAHRLTTIENADKVFLLEGGKVSDSGTFTELRRSSAAVAALVDRLSFKD